MFFSSFYLYVHITGASLSFSSTEKNVEKERERGGRSEREGGRERETEREGEGGREREGAREGGREREGEGEREGGSERERGGRERALAYICLHARLRSNLYVYIWFVCSNVLLNRIYRCNRCQVHSFWRL